MKNKLINLFLASCLTCFSQDSITKFSAFMEINTYINPRFNYSPSNQRFQGNEIQFLSSYNLGIKSSLGLGASFFYKKAFEKDVLIESMKYSCLKLLFFYKYTIKPNKNYLKIDLAYPILSYFDSEYSGTSYIWPSYSQISKNKTRKNLTVISLRYSHHLFKNLYISGGFAKYFGYGIQLNLGINYQFI